MNACEMEREAARLEARRAKLDIMEASLSAKSALLDEKMEEFVKRVRSERLLLRRNSSQHENGEKWRGRSPERRAMSEQRPIRGLSASARWAKCMREVDETLCASPPTPRDEKRAELELLRKSCEEMVGRQNLLKERADSVADAEARLEHRLLKLEEEANNPKDLTGPEEESTEFSKDTLDAAWVLLRDHHRRRRRKGIGSSKSQLEAAWLTTLELEVSRGNFQRPATFSRRKRGGWFAEDIFEQDELTAYAYPAPKLGGISAVLIVSICGFSDALRRCADRGLDEDLARLDRHTVFRAAFSTIEASGGKVLACTDGRIVAIFAHDDDSDDDGPSKACANAVLAGLSCAASQGFVASEGGPISALVSLGEVRAVEFRLGHDELRLAASGDALDRAKQGPSQPSRVAVDRQSARSLVRRGWPRKAFADAENAEGWMWVARAARPPARLAAVPPPTDEKSDLVDASVELARLPGLALRQVPASIVAAVAGTSRRPPHGRRASPPRSRPAAFLTAVCRLAANDDASGYLEVVTARINAATRAFGGLCCDLELVSAHVLEYTGVFWGSDDDKSKRHCALAAAAALATAAACEEETAFMISVGVAGGRAAVAVAAYSSRRLEPIAASSARENSKTLARAEVDWQAVQASWSSVQRPPRVLLDPESARCAESVPIPLSIMSFPAGVADDEDRLLVPSNAPNDRKWRAAAALIHNSTPPRVEAAKCDCLFRSLPPPTVAGFDSELRRTKGALCIPADLRAAVRNNIVPGGRKRRAVTRDVASVALDAYRTVFNSLWPSRLPSYEDDRNARPPLSSLSEAAWRSPPVSRGTFAAFAPLLFDEEEDDDDVAVDVLWVRSCGVPARAVALAQQRFDRGVSADYARGSWLPRLVKDRLLARVSTLPLSRQLLLRAAAVGSGAGGLGTLRASTLAVPALRDAFLAAVKLNGTEDFDASFAAAIKELYDKHWLSIAYDREDPSYSVTDRLVADALYSTTPPPRRKALHAAHAAALRASLEARSAADDLDVLRLAHHSLLAREPDLAFAAVAEIVARGASNFIVVAAQKSAHALRLPHNVPNVARAVAILSALPDVRAALLAIKTAGVTALVLKAAAALLTPVLRRRSERQLQNQIHDSPGTVHAASYSGFAAPTLTDPQPPVAWASS